MEASRVHRPPPQAAKPFAAWWFVYLAAAGPGCAPRHVESRPPPIPDPDVAEVVGGFRYPADPPVADSLMVRDLVQRARGRVVLLYFWSQFLEGGREELGRLAEFQERGRDAGLSVIACNMDDPADWRTRTRPLLMSVGASFPCVVVAEPTRQSLRTWLDPRWRYEKSASFVFDRAGDLVHRFISEPSFGRVQSTILDMLEDRPRPRRAMHLAKKPQVDLLLLDVRGGRASETAPSVACDSPDAVDPTAERFAQRIRSGSQQAGPAAPRVAVLPFCTRDDPAAAPPTGLRAAERFARALRVAGVQNVATPSEAAARLQSLDLTAASIESDPSVLTGRWAVDFVVLGWWNSATPATPALSSDPAAHSP